MRSETLVISGRYFGMERVIFILMATQIKVEMLMDEQNMGSLCLSIQAYLNIHPLYEPVIFDALLKPTTQQYVISARS